MKAIVYHGPRDFRVDDVPDPKIDTATDAVVRIERTAICGSDLHIYHGEMLPVAGFYCYAEISQYCLAVVQRRKKYHCKVARL